MDLRGYDPDGQLTAGQALGEVLRQLGGDGCGPAAGRGAGRAVPVVAARLADAGKPVLLVADSASIAAQVEALIPARGEHRLLVTSRDTLASIPGRLIDLDVLPLPAAADLIAQVLTSARPGDRRVRDEAVALQQVAELCGRLPLALQIAAEILKADRGCRSPRWPPSCRTPRPGWRHCPARMAMAGGGRCGPRSRPRTGGWP